MGFFDKIKNAIWGQAHAEIVPTTTSPETAAAQSIPSDAAPLPASSSSVASSQPVDVAAILDAAVKASGQKLDWKHSIVDLLKALNIDSSISARKELAHELGYTGDTADSATMNIWLHKAVVKKLSENGGKLPAELLD